MQQQARHAGRPLPWRAIGSLGSDRGGLLSLRAADPKLSVAPSLNRCRAHDEQDDPEIYRKRLLSCGPTRDANRLLQRSMIRTTAFQRRGLGHEGRLAPRRALNKARPEPLFILREPA
jgi:hypothetical protein